MRSFAALALRGTEQQATAARISAWALERHARRGVDLFDANSSGPADRPCIVRPLRRGSRRAPAVRWIGARRHESAAIRRKRTRGGLPFLLRRLNERSLEIGE
jgi:hypothetical protein